jgi:prophage regulatory protein
MHKASQEALIRKRQVLELTGWSNSTLYQRIADGKFKKGVRIGPRMVAWPLSEVQAYIAQCIAERDAGEPAVRTVVEKMYVGCIKTAESE